MVGRGPVTEAGRAPRGAVQVGRSTDEHSRSECLSRVRGSNSPPHDYKSSALPTELTRRGRIEHVYDEDDPADRLVGATRTRQWPVRVIGPNASVDSDVIERLLEIGHQVGGRLDADAEPHQRVGHLEW